MHEYGYECLLTPDGHKYEAVILAVAHKQFKSMNIRARGSTENCIVYDIKGVLKQEEVDERL
jgi:UDP-N-acetyl-D-glucosamine/UDP-N-acetyl-D-galactosamine dehydrogenase